MENKETFKPYVPAEKHMSELTATAIIAGVLLAIVFGAANAYLGLRVGMTVSASIPAAVIGMGVIRGILKKNSILESNMVQTIGSAGESLAAGCIFTLPALFLWAKEGLVEEPNLLTVSIIAISGGILGSLFMIPLRSSIIVKEHNILPYPEAKACSEVLLAGEKNSNGAKFIFSGMGIGALIKFILNGVSIIPETFSAKLTALKTEFSTSSSPALLGVGYIMGFKISAVTFAGGILAWFVLIPMIVTFGGNSVVFPQTKTIAEVFESGGVSAIWSSYIRYIGAGALTMAGIISLVKSIPLIFQTFAHAIKGMKNSSTASQIRTEKDLNFKFVIFGIVFVIAMLWALPWVQINFLGAILVVIFGFFFATVSARLVGLVGSSNNPASGMTIATLLLSTLLLKISGDTGSHGLVSAITIGSIICVIVALSGDMSQDLKTGHLLGATPKKQQIGELIGSIVSAISIGGVLILLNKAFGFGSEELAAPQAMLMKMVTEGVMSGNLPWTLIFIGAACAIIFEILGIPALAGCLGIYLPLETSAALFIGGIVRHILDKKNKNTTNESSSGILFSSGLIAGEGLMGILIAILAVTGVYEKINLAAHQLPTFTTLIIITLIIALIVKFSLPKKIKNGKEK